MSTLSMSESYLGIPWVGCLKAAPSCLPSELVKTFGSRVFSLATHITQNDEDAENVLTETFLEVSPDSDECPDEEALWLRLVTLAVKKALSNLASRGAVSGLDQVNNSYDLMVRELSIWGDDYQKRYSKKQMSHVLEDGLRSLDPMARTVFVLRDMEQISVDIIAGIVNRSVAAVEVCLLRGRLQLREALARCMRQRR
jgi:RNA polymerase sigma-70 factor (ECF subfamily)